MLLFKDTFTESHGCSEAAITAGHRRQRDPQSLHNGRNMQEEDRDKERTTRSKLVQLFSSNTPAPSANYADHNDTQI